MVGWDDTNQLEPDWPRIVAKGMDQPAIFKKGMLILQNLQGDVGSQSSPRVYIKYGVLLAWIQSNLFLYNKETQATNIEFDFNFDDLLSDQNFILNIPGQISTNPLNVLIPYKNFTFKRFPYSKIKKEGILFKNNIYV